MGRMETGPESCLTWNNIAFRTFKTDCRSLIWQYVNTRLVCFARPVDGWHCKVRDFGVILPIIVWFFSRHRATLESDGTENWTEILWQAWTTPGSARQTCARNRTPAFQQDLVLEQLQRYLQFFTTQTCFFSFIYSHAVYTQYELCTLQLTEAFYKNS